MSSHPVAATRTRRTRCSCAGHYTPRNATRPGSDQTGLKTAERSAHTYAMGRTILAEVVSGFSCRQRQDQMLRESYKPAGMSTRSVSKVKVIKLHAQIGQLETPDSLLFELLPSTRDTGSAESRRRQLRSDNTRASKSHHPASPWMYEWGSLTTILTWVIASEAE